MWASNKLALIDICLLHFVSVSNTRNEFRTTQLSMGLGDPNAGLPASQTHYPLSERGDKFCFFFFLPFFLRTMVRRLRMLPRFSLDPVISCAVKKRHSVISFDG